MFAVKGRLKVSLLVVGFLVVAFYVSQGLSDHGGAHPTTTYWLTVDIYYPAGTTTRPATGICPDGTRINGSQVIQMYDKYREWYFVTEYYSGHKTIRYHGMTYEGRVGYGTGQYTWHGTCPPSSGSNSASNN